MRRKNEVSPQFEDRPALDIVLIERDEHDFRLSGKDHWSLATVAGGLDKISVERRGNTTIVKIVSPEAVVYEEGWDRRPKRQLRRRVTPQLESVPG